MTALGFGKENLHLLIISPFMLLFSYNRIPKNRIISAVIPLVAVVLIFFMTLEGINMAIAGLLGGTKLDLVQIVNWLDTLKKMIGM